MTTLKGIKGDQIRYLDEDPVVQGIAGGSWSSGGALNNSRSEQQGTFGLQDAAIVVGQGNITESYNGTSWTEVNDLNTPRSRGTAVGIQTAGIAFGGVGDPTTPFPDATVAINESWNGTSWTEVGDLPVAKADYAGLGTQTAALSIMGSRGTPTTTVESWDGSAWTLGTATNSGRTNQAASGIQTAGLTYGGNNPGPTLRAFTESWNGTSWTEVGDLNTARVSLSGAGPNTAALAFAGGTPPATGATESWDGTSWTEVNDLATARGAYQSGAGTGNTSALLAGAGTYTEEWTTAPTNSLALQEGMLWFNSTSQTLKGYGTAAGIPAGTWASGGTMNQGRLAGSMGGTQTDAIYGGGLIPGGSTVDAETYDGSTWTEVNNMSTARYAGTGFGTSTPTTMIVAGIGPGPTVYGVSEAYNGSIWTEVADLNTSRWYLGSASSGTNTDGLVFGGFNQAVTVQYAQTESYNGTSWAEVNDLNTAKGYPVGFGTPGSAGSANGFILPGTYPSPTETWDGTSWTNTGQNFNTPRSTAGGSAGGSSSSGMVFGGQQPGPIANTEYWNGSTWTELADLSVGNEYIVGTGSTVSALGASGDSYTTASEEWNAPADVVTITTS
jgi:serine/threonine-protein kinase PknK